MIGNASRGVHAQQRHEDHARRVQADPQRHERAQHEVPGEPDGEAWPLETERVAAARDGLREARHDDHRRDEEERPHAELDAAARPAGDDAGADPRSRDRGRDHERERLHLDLHDEDEHDGLGEGRHGVADVERAGDVLVVDDLAELEERGRERERADAERVEEVGDEADHELQRRRPDAHAGDARASCLAHPHGDENDPHDPEQREQEELGGDLHPVRRL